jgi:nucleotide-binding universal stress UspA family protein
MNILLAVDGSPDSQKAVSELVMRPWPSKSTVRILTAVPSYRPPMFEFVSTGETPAEVQSGYEKAAANLTKTVAESLRSTELLVETTVRPGDPRRVIIEEAAEWGADLIMIGARGHSALERWLIGSVAQNVVAHAPCSVEVVRHT